MTIYWWCLLCGETGQGDGHAAKHTKDTHHPTMTSIHPKPVDTTEDLRFRDA